MKFLANLPCDDGDDVTLAAFLSLVAEEQYSVATATLPTRVSAPEIAKLLGLENVRTAGSAAFNVSRAWGRLNGALVHLFHYASASQLTIEVAADENAVISTFDYIVARIPPPPEPPEDIVEMTFWTWTPNGPVTYLRDVTTFSWEDVAGNYSRHSRTALDNLMAYEPTGEESGRIAILHGPPGTGKTTAIRALARAWKPWCDSHYVVDPETFFNVPSYLFNLLLAGDASRWRVVIVEDAEEFLTPDAKEHVGQGVSRLLNLSDGLIGQGTKVLVLMTTNAPLGKLHPAITRPGRCFANIEVPKMSAEESATWLREHELVGAGSEVALAELYERLNREKIANAPGPGAGTGGQYL